MPAVLGLLRNETDPKVVPSASPQRGRPPKPDVAAADVTGLKYFEKLAPLLERLHAVGCERDQAATESCTTTSCACCSCWACSIQHHSPGAAQRRSRGALPWVVDPATNADPERVAHTTVRGTPSAYDGPLSPGDLGCAEYRGPRLWCITPTAYELEKCAASKLARRAGVTTAVRQAVINGFGSPWRASRSYSPPADPNSRPCLPFRAPQASLESPASLPFLPPLPREQLLVRTVLDVSPLRCGPRESPSSHEIFGTKVRFRGEECQQSNNGRWDNQGGESVRKCDGPPLDICEENEF
jgi:hypothetical protein